MHKTRTNFHELTQLLMNTSCFCNITVTWEEVSCSLTVNKMLLGYNVE